MALTYDIVIATRNRPEILRISISLMLSQSRRPQRLIVVDSSTDEAAARTAMMEAAGGFDGELHFRRAEPGSARQRNLGLQLVQAPVVMFPDDDALWFPGTAEAIMRAYERDERGDIGAVCAAEALEPPGGVPAANAATRVSWVDRFKVLIGKRRNQIERAVAPDPFHIHGRSCWGVRAAPAWLEEENCVLVEWMTGFRMSFRTEMIRACGFDEKLGAYSLFEDTDASFAVMHSRLIVGARNAKIFHHKIPGRRGSGYEMGFTQLLNRAYVVAKHAAPGSEARRRLSGYAWYKLLQYLLGAHSRYGRQRISGAWRALRCQHDLLNAPLAELSEVYCRLRAAHLGS